MVDVHSSTIHLCDLYRRFPARTSGALLHILEANLAETNRFECWPFTPFLKPFDGVNHTYLECERRGERFSLRLFFGGTDNPVAWNQEKQEESYIANHKHLTN